MTLHWKHKGFSGRDIILGTSQEPVGMLLFKGWAGYDANYTSRTASISFTTEGWLEQKVIIRFNGEVIGSATTSVFGKTELRMLTGELYTLPGKAFSYNRTVLDDAGNPLIRFEQDTLSFSKGRIEVTEDLPELTREVLVGTSLYLKALTEQQVAILVVIFMPLIVRFIS